ncbi:hypothetical protein LAZ67_6000827 [Cordylochernes scorpioides]|uniref:Reverse transcriptase domain-containing protein n=1 Tax=Cordylochernes scorpioides TaxID=51811 RepID=A0ABY6KJ88_9ARAC|nr:hypothetical protein LAZ67_6000827 [Cordylochernes scorpioides]
MFYGLGWNLLGRSHSTPYFSARNPDWTEVSGRDLGSICDASSIGNGRKLSYIYGLPKTHKPDVPLRPIVAYHLSPALHLARYLSNFLKPLVKAHNIYSIQDSSDFIAKLKNFSQSDSPTMSTFDVTSLFLSLPHSLIFDGLGSLLNSPAVSNKDQKVVSELFNICLGMNTLEFNGRFFLQIRGSPMGSPLSTTAAEIVMSYLDRWLVSQIHLGVVMWARYVDDIFCLHQSTDHSLSSLIPCNDCPQSYVGETGRTIATRVLEHDRNIRSHDRKSLIYQHSNEFNHSFNLRNTIPKCLTLVMGNATGGGSAINGMIYTRGTAQDFDDWFQNHGAYGWSYAGLEPIFKSLEQYNGPPNPAYGVNGQRYLSYVNDDFSLAEAPFREAGTEMTKPYDTNQGLINIDNSDKLQSFLVANNIDTQTASHILQLASLCLSVCTFTFNKQFYKQTRGTPMGSPLSSIISEIVMGSLDAWINQALPSDIYYWRRYVDDIFCIIKTDSLQLTYSTLHDFNPHIKFTYETEIGSVLPFLDILIIRTPQSFHTSVFHKKHIPPQYTHFSSNSPISFKINTVRTLTKRIVTHCSLPIFKTIERSRIHSLLTTAGYPIDFIVKHTFDPSVQRTTTIHRATCWLPFSPAAVSISRVLRPYGIKVLYNSPPSLATILRHHITKSDKPTLPINSTGAVYSIQCLDCPTSYVGETGRTTGIRISEHRRNIRNKDPKSLIFTHIAQTGHSFDLDHPQEYVKENRPFVDLSTEFSKYVLSQTGVYTIPNFYNSIAFFNSSSRDSEPPNIELNLGPTLTYNAVFGGQLSGIGDEGFAILVTLTKPYSRGKLVINSTDPYQSPVIDFNYFDDPRDMQHLVEGRVVLYNIQK